nr:hypothetical protein [Candidatus Sigynarchaeota archaeon]
MTLKLNVVKGGDVRATTFHGRVVLPNEARHVWDLDSLQWYARARMMGENIVEISIKNNPHSLVCLEFYIEVDKLDPVHVVHVDAMLVFSSDIPEFNGTGFVSIKATSGTFTIESIGTK